MTTYEEMRAALLARTDAEFGRGASEQEIAEAEAAIGAIPHDYKRYLREFGWVTFNSFDFWGLGADLPHRSLDTVAMTLDERQLGGLPADMIGFYNDGGGNIECFAARGTAADQSYGVFCFFHEDRQLYRDADSFTDYMMSKLATPPFFDESDGASG